MHSSYANASAVASVLVRSCKRFPLCLLSPDTCKGVLLPAVQVACGWSTSSSCKTTVPLVLRCQWRKPAREHFPSPWHSYSRNALLALGRACLRLCCLLGTALHPQTPHKCWRGSENCRRPHQDRTHKAGKPCAGARSLIYPYGSTLRESQGASCISCPFPARTLLSLGIAESRGVHSVPRHPSPACAGAHLEGTSPAAPTALTSIASSSSAYRWVFSSALGHTGPCGRRCPGDCKTRRKAGAAGQPASWSFLSEGKN